MAFRAATCPTCAGELQVPDDRDVVKCMYCGNDVIVREAIRAASGASPENLLKLAKTASESGNSEEAFQYSNKVLELTPTHHQAWFIKAEAAGWMSTLRSFRIPEMLTGFQNAVEFAPEEKKDDVQSDAAQTMNRICVAFYQAARNHFDEFIKLDNSWETYLNQCAQILTALEISHQYTPSDKQIVENIIHICKDNIEGAVFVDWELTNEWSSKLKVSEEHEAALKEKRDKYIQKMRGLDPEYEPEPIQKKTEGGGCFIATATMGSYHDPAVLSLRKFRDAYLHRRRAGRLLIRVYYRFSPGIARYIEESDFLRRISLYLVVRPSVWVVEKRNYSGR